MQFTRDSFKHITPPHLLLRKASGERVGILQTTELTYDANFNDFNILQFKIPLYINDEKNPYYEYIQEMMYIETDDELFVISTVDIASEGSRQEYKSVQCKDYSWMLSTRYLVDFVINTGAVESLDNVVLYKPSSPDQSLLNLCINELFPEWTIGGVHGDIAGKQRSFEVSKSSVYDFLMNNVAEAFECVFVFNTLAKQINVYPQSSYGDNTGIMVSYNNLLKSTNANLNVESIKTSLVVRGADDVNIREVSRSSDRIYNFNYYNSTDYMSESLYNAYNAWQTLTYNTPVDWNYLRYNLKDTNGNLYFVFDNTTDLDGNYIMRFGTMQSEYTTFLRNNGYQDNYNNLYTFLLNKYQKYFTDIITWKSTKIPAGNDARYFGYGDYPTGYPNNINTDSEDTFTIDRYSSVERVTSLSSASKDEDTLYLIKNDSNFGMYRWYNKSWINTNNWSSIALNPLTEKLKSAEQNQNAAMKNGYGGELPVTGEAATNTEKARQLENYIEHYLPYYYAVCSLNNYINGNTSLGIQGVQQKINICETAQNRINRAMQGIAYLTDMTTNFTVAQLKELSTFIREDELTSENFVVTDEMTEEERFEMITALLKFGEEELDKVAQPQMTFSADVVNLFAMPEFDRYNGYINPGNLITVSLRDDYMVKPRIIQVHYNFYNENDFSLTFSNILRKNKEVWGDIQDAINEAHTAATSVSFNQSYWSAQAKNADTLTQQLANGLLEAGKFLRSGIHSEFLVDERGLWITTVSDNPSDPNYPYAKISETDTSYDSVYIGGGRILFTDDGWQTVRMSVGRGIVSWPTKTSSGITFQDTSMFGVFADFVIAGYVASSIIVGGDIYSSNYKHSTLVSSGNVGTHINLNDGSFEFNSSDSSGKKRLILNNNTLTVYGVVQASSGHIGCDDNGNGGFQITSEAIYKNKPNLNKTNTDGVYISTEGIALGNVISYTIGNGTESHSQFEVNDSGNLYAGNANITGTVYATAGSFGNGSNKIIIGSNELNSYIYGGSKTGMTVDQDGFYLGTDGFALGKIVNYKTIGDVNIGKKSKFEVTTGGVLYANEAYIKGAIYATKGTIGGFTITSSSLYNGKDKINANLQGVFLGTAGIALGTTVDYKTIGGTEVGVKSKFQVGKNGVLYANGAYLKGKIYTTAGYIGGFTIGSNSIYNTKTTISTNSAGVYIGTNGIGLGPMVYYDNTQHSTFEVTKQGDLYANNVHIKGYLKLYQKVSIDGHSYDDVWDAIYWLDDWVSKAIRALEEGDWKADKRLTKIESYLGI